MSRLARLTMNMKWMRSAFLIASLGFGFVSANAQTAAQTAPQKPDYQRSVYSPLHFKPAIDTASDEQCLACHKEVLEDSIRSQSPAGVSPKQTLAWYQQLATYEGKQETFHRRHLVTPLAKAVMNLHCNTCHQGSDIREAAPGSSATAAPIGTPDFTLRKKVNPETTCLKCHSQHNSPVMGLPSPWTTSGESFQNNCLLCHAAIRTNRHQVTYLNAKAIEEMAEKEAAAQKPTDVCYGCHGGRAWYRITYPYPRHPWPEMDEKAEMPDWAKDRPTQSEERFRLKTETSGSKK